MKLTAAELAYVRSYGLFVLGKCDACQRLLNVSVQYTIAGRREIYCSSVCRDGVYFGNPREADKRGTPGRCAYCGGSLEGKKRGSIFCADRCRKAHSRKIQHTAAAEVEKSRTPTQLNERVTSPKTGGQGDCIPSGAQPLKNAPGEVAPKIRLPVEGERAWKWGKSQARPSDG
jgi:hypothetical protein